MKRIACLLILALLLGGCSTYRFSKGKPPYDKGYVAYRDDYMIPEYTVGKDSTAPNVKLAKERFKRRRDKVEYYYKRMGYIDNYFKITFWEPITSIVRIAGGVFLLPYTMISDYRYEHNPEYRERIIRQEEQKDAFLEARINKIKAQLHEYIEDDLAREEGKPVVKEKPRKVKREKPTRKRAVRLTRPAEEAPVVKERPAVAEAEPPKAAAEVKPVEEKPAEEKPKVVEKKEIPEVAKEKPRKPPAAEKTRPVAVIVAKPVRGLSPLKVRFYGNQSRSPKGRIVSYHWDFGDGDTSTKANPTNTYWSGSFLPQEFEVTLTVQDDKGNTAQDSVVIEVANR